MDYNDFTLLLQDWTTTCGPSSYLIIAMQVAILLYVFAVSVKTKTSGLKKYYIYVAIALLVPLIGGLLSYMTGVQKGEQAIQMAQAADIEKLRMHSKFVAMSCVVGSLTHIFWVLPIVVITTIVHLFKNRK